MSVVILPNSVLVALLSSKCRYRDLGSRHIPFFRIPFLLQEKNKCLFKGQIGLQMLKKHESECLSFTHLIELSRAELRLFCYLISQFLCVKMYGLLLSQFLVFRVSATFLKQTNLLILFIYF